MEAATTPAKPRRPVLLAVDDDPGVGRAVQRDLRRRYGEKFQVVGADSGPAALDVLDQLALRGQGVALLLADQRMPGMEGVDFLELAMDKAPAAKRVLLTAYADTNAAIKAINDVKLDHYLTKPWDPPEENLYPVVDDLLTDWEADMRQRVATEQVRELAYEMERWKYLARHNLLGSAETASHDPTEFRFFVPGKSELLPIPTSETARNPNVRQNPGY